MSTVMMRGRQGVWWHLQSSHGAGRECGGAYSHDAGQTGSVVISVYSHDLGQAETSRDLELTGQPV